MARPKPPAAKAAQDDVMNYVRRRIGERFDRSAKTVTQLADETEGIVSRPQLQKFLGDDPDRPLGVAQIYGVAKALNVSAYEILPPSIEGAAADERYQATSGNTSKHQPIGFDRPGSGSDRDAPIAPDLLPEGLGGFLDRYGPRERITVPELGTLARAHFLSEPNAKFDDTFWLDILRVVRGLDARRRDAPKSGSRKG